MYSRLLLLACEVNVEKRSRLVDLHWRTLYYTIPNFLSPFPDLDTVFLVVVAAECLVDDEKESFSPSHRDRPLSI